MQPIEIGLDSAMASREHPIRQAGRQARQGAGTPKGWAQEEDSGHVASRCWSIETVQRARAVTLATNIIWQQFSCLSPLFFFSFALRFCFLLTRSYKFHSGKWFLLATDHTSRPVQTRPDHTHTHTLTTLQC